MKFKVTLVTASLALLMVNSSWAQDAAYYDIEVISVSTDGALYGPFPAAMSEDGKLIATFSHRASLSADIDIGLPFTFNRDCQFDDELCELEFYGSESSGDFSYLNAYQAWRNAQSDADLGSYEQYMFANTLVDQVDQGAESPFWSDSTDGDEQSSDIKATDITDEYVVGYASAPYENGAREFARRAYIKSVTTDTVTALLPDFTTSGGFSGAYKLKEVTYTDSDGIGADSTKTLVIGSASASYAGGDSDYFEYCYNTTEDDDRFDMNDLIFCPGFDTQAWAWDITSITEGDDQKGFALATAWLDNNDTGDSLTFSANAFDINTAGIAVGASTFEYSDDDEGGRQRAIIMTPAYNVTDDDYEYLVPVELTAATDDIDDQDDLIYNTWALTISDDGIVTGNREYNTSKASNLPTEFFVYDNETSKIDFPLLDLKVATTKQRLENNSFYVAKTGANSRVYDANESNWMVGTVDDYDQTDPVEDGKPRSQTAFLYDNDNDQAWLINDLLCTRDADGTVNLPDELYRIRSARVINDLGVVLAEGFSYPSETDYTNLTNATQVALKLTPNAAVTSPNDSPNCWESALLADSDEDFSRSGAGSLWLMLLALPLMLVRRFKR